MRLTRRDCEQALQRLSHRSHPGKPGTEILGLADVRFLDLVPRIDDMEERRQESPVLVGQRQVRRTDVRFRSRGRRQSCRWPECERLPIGRDRRHGRRRWRVKLRHPRGRRCRARGRDIGGCAREAVCSGRAAGVPDPEAGGAPQRDQITATETAKARSKIASSQRNRRPEVSNVGGAAGAGRGGRSSFANTTPHRGQSSNPGSANPQRGQLLLMQGSAPPLREVRTREHGICARPLPSRLVASGSRAMAATPSA